MKRKRTEMLKACKRAAKREVSTPCTSGRVQMVPRRITSSDKLNTSAHRGKE